MKMTKRKAALFAVFAVAVVALAGVGYATYTYSATTTTTNGNTATSNYVVISLNDEAYTGANTIHLIYDTETTHPSTENVTKYKLNANSTLFSITVNFDKDAAVDGSTYSLTFNKPTVEIPGASSVEWKWNGETTSGTETIASDTTSGTLSLVCTSSGSFESITPPTSSISIGSITFVLTATK